MDNNFKYDVFISYRRNGGSERAELIKVMLEQHGYDPNRIYMDTHSMDSGNFKQHLKKAIYQSQSFILIITKGCFDQIKVEDYWIFEIEEAISLGRQIIPIFFDGIETIDTSLLPDCIQSLSEIDGIHYYHKYSDACYLKLLNRLNPPFVKQTKLTKKKRITFLFYFGIIGLQTIIIILLYVHLSHVEQKDSYTNGLNTATLTKDKIPVIAGETGKKDLHNKEYQDFRNFKEEASDIIDDIKTSINGKYDAKVYMDSCNHDFIFFHGRISFKHF